MKKPKYWEAWWDWMKNKCPNKQPPKELNDCLGCCIKSSCTEVLRKKKKYYGYTFRQSILCTENEKRID